MLLQKNCMQPDIYFLRICSSSSSSFSDGEICQVYPNRLGGPPGYANASIDDDSDLTTPAIEEEQVLTCPGPNDPADFKACCYEEFEDDDEEEEDDDEIMNETTTVTTTEGDATSTPGTTTTTTSSTTKATTKKPMKAKIRRPRCCPPKKDIIDWIIGLDERQVFQSNI